MEYNRVNIPDELLDNGICIPFNRTAIFCGQCMDERDHLPTPSALSVSIVVVKQVGIEFLYIFKLLMAH